MSPTTYTRVVTTREQAHFVITEAYAQAKALIASGARVRITAAQDFDELSARQRRFLHGPVLGQISEQVCVEGVRYARDVWKEYFRNEFLGSKWVMVKRPFKQRAVRIKQRISTEDLNDQEYSEYIDRVIAHAATEWGVQFRFQEGEREAARWQPTRRKRRELAFVERVNEAPVAVLEAPAC